MSSLLWLEDTSQVFPKISPSMPDGLLAAGGNLSPSLIVSAYRNGAFPWYEEDQPILWWSPNPRCVMFPGKLKISRSLKKTINRQVFSVTFNEAFSDVIIQCAAPRQGSEGTWITAEMQAAYVQLNKLGIAHSVEAWVEEQGERKLVGGLYGLAIGKVFFGESMFSRYTDASKVAFSHLVRQLEKTGFSLIDCQVHSEHLASLGSETIPRVEFLQLLNQYSEETPEEPPWQGMAL